MQRCLLVQSWKGEGLFVRNTYFMCFLLCYVCIWQSTSHRYLKHSHWIAHPSICVPIVSPSTWLMCRAKRSLIIASFHDATSLFIKCLTRTVTLHWPWCWHLERLWSDLCTPCLDWRSVITAKLHHLSPRNHKCPPRHGRVSQNCFCTYFHVGLCKFCLFVDMRKFDSSTF